MGFRVEGFRGLEDVGFRVSVSGDVYPYEKASSLWTAPSGFHIMGEPRVFRPAPSSANEPLTRFAFELRVLPSVLP